MPACSRLLALTPLLLAACGQVPKAQVGMPNAPVAGAGDAAVVREVAPPDESPAPPPVPVDPGSLSLTGAVTLPKGLTGLANAHGGIVSGAPVLIKDVATSKQIGRGITYYDGSYEAEVPVSVGKRAVVVEVMLVSENGHLPIFPLEAAFVTAPELVTQTQDVGPATTAWVALLTRLAAKQIKAPEPDWAQIEPGGTALALAALVKDSEAKAQAGFVAFADGSGGFGEATSPGALRARIDQLVGQLASSAASPTPVAQARSPGSEAR